MDIIVGIVAIVLGLVLTFAGLRLFFATLPILGFILGFFVGAAGVQAVFGDGIFSTLTSWLVGLIVGVFFAAISYLWWYVGALIAAGSTGALIGTSLVRAFGGSAHWLLALFAVIGFIVVLVLAFMLALPVYIVLFNTAIAGATVVVAGFLLIIDKINRGELGDGTAVAIINESWWWMIPWIVLAAVGIASQLNNLASVVLPEERWAPARA
jgi:hypothetical protein